MVRDFGLALNVKISRFLQHRAHASNSAKRGQPTLGWASPLLSANVCDGECVYL